MRFHSHFLAVLLAGTPLLAPAQTAQNTLLPQPLASSEATPASDGSETGSGCGNGYAGFIKRGDKGLAGASVLVKGSGSVMVVSNSDGFFVLPPSVRGWPTLSVSAMGYEPVTVTYSACEPITVDLKVAPGTRFKKHGRKKGYLVLPKRK